MILPPLEERTVPALLERNARANPSAPLLVSLDETLSCGEVWDLVQVASSRLADLGCAHGARVGLLMDNSRAFVLAWFAIVSTGGVEVPMDPQAPAERIVYMLNHSGAELVIVDAAHLELLNAVADRLTWVKRVVVVGGSRPESHLETTPFNELLRGESGPLAAVGPADPGGILYTSGSTGPPKGVVLPHAQHVMNGWQAASRAELQPHDRSFIALPLHHNMAQGYGVMPALVAGSQVYLGDVFRRSRFWAEVIASKSTVLPFIGSMLSLLISTEPGGESNPLRVAYGVPLSKEVHDQFEARFGVRLLHGYGSTEATIVSWGSLADDTPRGSAGRVIDAYDVEIHDENDRALPQGTIGEICVRSREPFSMFLGYFRDEQRTLAALRNLWFHTGDRGRFDVDRNLWFEGRTGDTIRRFGEFIAANDIEEAVARHPDVEVVAAFGVESDVVGQEVMVSVVVRPGATIDPDGLRRWVTPLLPKVAVPRFVDLVPELPTTATGKVAKYELRERGVTPTTDDVRSP